MNNIWNPILIDSDKYMKILDYIRLAKSEIYLPINFTFSDLYQISKISAHNFENQLIFLLTIPLISNNEFKLYKIHSVTALKNFGETHQFKIFSEPKIEYLGLSTDSNTYFKFNEQWIHSCSSLSFGNFCQFEVTIFYTDENPVCESSLLTNSLTSDCPLKVTSDKKPQWIPLKEKNPWIYLMQSNKTIYYSCKSGVKSSFNIMGSGKLKIEPTCTIDIKNQFFPKILYNENLLKPNELTSFFMPIPTLNTPFLSKISKDKTIKSQVILNQCEEWINSENILPLSALESRAIIFSEAIISNQKNQTLYIQGILSISILFLLLITVIISILTIYTKVIKHINNQKLTDYYETHLNLNILDHETVNSAPNFPSPSSSFLDNLTKKLESIAEED